MPSTRSSARQAESNPSSQTEDNNKRKAEDSQTTPSKRGRKDAENGQKTLEETLGADDQKTLEDSIDTNEKELEKDIDTEMKDSKDIQKPGQSFEGQTKDGESMKDPEKALKESRGGQGLNAIGGDKPQAKGVPHVSTARLRNVPLSQLLPRKKS